MNRSKVLCLLVTALLSLAPAVPAYPWAYATHAYFAERLGERMGNLNFQKMYGSLLPDQYNFILTPVGEYLAVQTHANPEAVTGAAGDCATQAVAFGFATHNEIWGADFTAHVASLTLPESPPKGYVIIKGDELAPDLVAPLTEILVVAGADPVQAPFIAAGIAPFLGHLLVEEAVDWLIKKELEPSIGTRIMNAARLRTAKTPLLLASAYAPGVSSTFGMSLAEATGMIFEVERQYRQMSLDLGRGFLGNPERVMDFLAQQGVTVGQLYIKAATGYDVVISPELAESFTRQAATLVESTYEAELIATLAYLEDELENRGVETCEVRGR
jgi:hypothetical protein